MDQNGNTTSGSEYDWVASSSISRNGNSMVTAIGCPPSGSCPVRSTSTTYYNSSTPYWTHSSTTYLRAKQNVSVAAGAPQNSASPNYVYVYDNPATTANVQQMQALDDTLGTYITTNWTYLSNGNVSAEVDPNGIETLTCYDGSNLYPVKRIVAAQTGTSCAAPQALAEGRTTTWTRDSNNTGQVITETDADNSIVTTYAYDDTGRVKRVEEAGGTLDRVTTTTYDDLNLAVTVTSDNAPGPQLTTTTSYDAMGRVRLIVDGAGNKVQKAYRYGNGVSYELASNSYLTTSDPTMGWTLTTQDAAGRVTSVDHYPGSNAPGYTATGGSGGPVTIPPSLASNPPAAWGTAATTSSTGTATAAYDQTVPGCAGPGIKTTDEAGNAHSNCYDGLGRLTSVTEPDAASGGTGAVTSYAYDVRDNPIGVSVAGQANSTCTASDGHAYTRCFAYSTLSRLTTATNPEGGRISYVYDKNGNLTQRTDLNNNMTSIPQYDALNRPQRVSYTAVAPTAITPSVCYSYDQDSGGTHHFKGALFSVTNLASTCTGGAVEALASTTAYTYDGLGRISSSAQTPGGGSSYQFFYQYSLTDQLTDLKYPSGREVNYALDAAGRVNTLKNVATGNNYASINYTPSGTVSTTMTMGNGVVQGFSLNDRLQLTGIQVTSPNNTSLLAITLYPCTGGLTACRSTGAAGNNGTVQSQTIALPGLSLSKTYTYDRLNRITQASETGGGGNWTETYGLDASGNRWSSRPSPPLPAQTLETVVSSSFYSNSPVVNRVNSPWNYDASGNLQTVGGMDRNFTYDAENRQVTAEIGGATSTYVYDGNGQRVSKTVNGQTTTYVYDAQGNLAAEYETPGTSVSPCGTPTCYLTQDHLGSTRLVTDSAGSSSTAVRYDYLPFGQEVPADADGRTVAMGYVALPDGMNPKFTGQMRDTETGLDYFNARYYSPLQGRFQSVDPGNAGAVLGDPQTHNGYAYVGNSPLCYNDPSGQFAEATTIGASAGGPVGAAIGAGIDIGIALWGIFGGSAPSVPSWSGTAWELGPDQTVAGVGIDASASPQGDTLSGRPFIGGLNAGGLYGLTSTSGGTNAKQPWPTNTPILYGEIPLEAEATVAYRALGAVGETIYVGITKRLAARAAEHSGRFTIAAIRNLPTLSLADAKAVEQALIEFYKLGKNGRSLVNKINSIAKTNPIYTESINRGIEILRGIGFPGF